MWGAFHSPAGAGLPCPGQSAGRGGRGCARAYAWLRGQGAVGLHSPTHPPGQGLGTCVRARMHGCVCGGSPHSSAGSGHAWSGVHVCMCGSPPLIFGSGSRCCWAALSCPGRPLQLGEGACMQGCACAVVGGSSRVSLLPPPTGQGMRAWGWGGPPHLPSGQVVIAAGLGCPAPVRHCSGWGW